MVAHSWVSYHDDNDEDGSKAITTITITIIITIIFLLLVIIIEKKLYIRHCPLASKCKQSLLRDRGCGQSRHWPQIQKELLEKYKRTSVEKYKKSLLTNTKGSD